MIKKNSPLFTQADTMKMYWAYGDRDVHQLDQIHFKTKGMRSIYLLNPSFGREQEVSVSYWDVQMKEVSLFLQIIL